MPDKPVLFITIPANSNILYTKVSSSEIWNSKFVVAYELYKALLLTTTYAHSTGLGILKQSTVITEVSSLSS